MTCYSMPGTGLGTPQASSCSISAQLRGRIISPILPVRTLRLREVKELAWVMEPASDSGKAGLPTASRLFPALYPLSKLGIGNGEHFPEEVTEEEETGREAGFVFSVRM